MSNHLSATVDSTKSKTYEHGRQMGIHFPNNDDDAPSINFRQSKLAVFIRRRLSLIKTCAYTGRKRR